MYNLPPHQWINLRLQVVIIDEWLDNSLVLEVGSPDYNPDAIANPQEIWRATFNNSMRWADFCGKVQIFDSMEVIDAWAQHNSSMAKLRLRVLESGDTSTATDPIRQLSWGVREALIRVGTCGRHCEECTGPSNCLKCYAPYK